MTDEIKQDGAYENAFLGVGNTTDRSAYTKAGNSPLLMQGELERLYQNDGFARRIVDLPAQEMIRAGYEIEGVDEDEDVRAALENIGASAKIGEALAWAGLFGGSMIVMLVNDGGEFTDPLNLERVKSVEQLRVYDRHQVTRQQRYDDPSDMRFGKPKTWMISPTTGTPYEVHETRCLVFDGARVPSRVREENDGWGGPRLQFAYEQMTRFGMSQYWANALLERAQQAVHGIPELTNLLRSKDGESLIKKRIALVDMARSINNTVVIDSNESYDLKSTSLAGVADLIDRFALALSAVTGIPESLLFGRQKSGLSTSGGADLENWYASIAQQQNTVLLEPLDRLVTVQLYAMGRYVDEYLIKFKPLFVPTSKEIADTRKVRAETAKIYTDMQALDGSEVRKALGDEGFDIDDVEQLPEGGDNGEENAILES